MINYQYDDKNLRIDEIANTEDIEFKIQIVEEGSYLEAFQQVKSFFEDNDVYTDVLFYAYANREYRVIVRQDYYIDFIMMLFKHRLLQAVEWKSV